MTIQEIHRKPAPSRLAQTAEFLVYLLAIVGGVVFIAGISYVFIPTMMWAAVPASLGLYALYRINSLTGIVGAAESSSPTVLEQPVTRVLFGSIIAAAVGAGLTMTGTPAIGFPMVLVAFPVVFLTFGIKLGWVARRGGRRSLLVWDLLGRGSLLAFGVWIALEMVLVVAGEPTLGLSGSVSNLLAVVGIAFPLVYLLLERPFVRKQLLQIDITPITKVVTLVPALEYWTPSEPSEGESWRQVTKPEEAPSIGEDPSNRSYQAKR